MRGHYSFVHEHQVFLYTIENVDAENVNFNNNNNKSLSQVIT